ncbi:MAG: hypothetical protein MK213_02410, partial [Planctomycetes bacterium]|nr:hypothetical protein [Planctomycetota bacterium]
MLMFAVLAVCCQGGGAPPLPPALAQQEPLQNALRALEATTDPAARREAAQVLLEALPGAKPRAQACFLMLVDAHHAFPAEVSLRGSWDRLTKEHEQVLVFVAETLRDDSDQALLQGALSAAGHLRMSTPALVETVAARLNEPAHAGFARRSLFQITRHEFVDGNAFGDWWTTAREQGREEWLERALDRAGGRELQLWKETLAADPSASLRAVRSNVRAVRALGFEAMPGLQADDVSGNTLREVFYSERDTELRRALVGLIPQFLLGAEAMALLDQALEAADSGERLQAARVLLRVRPAEEARTGITRHLTRVYVTREQGVGDGPAFRSALLGGLQELAESLAGGEADPQISLILVRAFDREPDAGVRSQAYEAVGALGWSEFTDVLLPRALNENLPAPERSAALDALTRLASHSGPSERLLQVLHDLLVDESLAYRAVQCLAQLNAAESVEPLTLALSSANEEFLVDAILNALTGLPSSEAGVDGLLRHASPVDGHEPYVSALIQQVGPALESFQRSLSVLQEQGQWRTAFRLLEAFPRGELSEADAAPLHLAHARVLARWILRDGLEQVGATRVADAVTRVTQAGAVEPESSEWPILEARLERLRLDPAASFSAFQRALALQLEDADTWPLRMEAVEVAAAAKLQGAGLALLEQGGAVPPSFQAAVDALRAQFEALSSEVVSVL